MRCRRARSKRIEQADALLLPLIRELKAEHPFWGYRRVWARLRFAERIAVNQKRVYRLMKEHALLVPKDLRAACEARESACKATSRVSEQVVGHRYDEGDDRRRLGLRCHCHRLVHEADFRR